VERVGVSLMADLVGRMLLCTRNHLIPSSSDIFADPKIMETLQNYSSPASGFGEGIPVYRYDNNLVPCVKGVIPTTSQKVVYVDGTFDLFTPGHIELLRLIHNSDPSSYLVVGLHDDYTINKIKGYNYPIMNIVERTLVLLQCKYLSALVISAPYIPSKEYLTLHLGDLSPREVWHGPTPVIGDPYADAKSLGMFRQIKSHDWDDMSASKIVQRILDRKLEFEERQRKKGVKTDLERELKTSFEGETLENNL
jgi:ethanolamine-phosphate cytidylyltransferase